MGFEPMTPVSQGNRLAGGRTRPLCDPSDIGLQMIAGDADAHQGLRSLSPLCATLSFCAVSHRTPNLIVFVKTFTKCVKPHPESNYRNVPTPSFLRSQESIPGGGAMGGALVPLPQTGEGQGEGGPRWGNRILTLARIR